MTNFNSRQADHKALKAAGWTELLWWPVGCWAGIPPGGGNPCMCPFPSRDVKVALEMARPFLPLWNLAFYGELIEVITRSDDGEEIVIGSAEYADCDDRADLAMARALTLAMREMGK